MDAEWWYKLSVGDQHDVEPRALHYHEKAIRLHSEQHVLHLKNKIFLPVGGTI